MSQQLSLEFLDTPTPPSLDAPGNTRSEQRNPIVRIVEYTPYPRRTRNERRQVGFTRDTSPSGMCLAVETPEKPGALLRVIATDVDGNPSSDDLARVAWCEPRRDGRFWLGLDVMSATQVGRMLKVRHTVRRQKIAVHN
jgi:hypothetical protein